MDRKEEIAEESTEPMVEHPSYTTPTKILRRPENEKVYEAAEVEKRNRDRAIVASIQRPSDIPRQSDLPDAIVGDSNEVASEANVPGESGQGLEPTHQLEVAQNELDTKGNEGIDKIDEIDKMPNDQVYCHDEGELFAEDVHQHMTVLPEVVVPGGEVTIEDVQVGDPNTPLTEDQK